MWHYWFYLEMWICMTKGFTKFSCIRFTLAEGTQCLSRLQVDQLPVIEVTQIFMYLASTGLLSLHTSSNSWPFINVSWHGTTNSNHLQKGVGGLEWGREEEERGREKMRGKIEKWKIYSMSLCFSNLHDCQDHMESCYHTDAGPTLSFWFRSGVGPKNLHF